MIKKINEYINLSIITSILFVVLGILILLFPNTILNIFSYSTAVLAIITGLYFIVLEIRTKNNLIAIDSSLFGVLLLVLGFIIIAHPNAFKTIIPLALGIWFITSSVMKFRITTILKNENFGIYLFSLIMTILSIICGVLFILNPIESSKVITSTFGLIMIIYSISDICEMIIFKKNIKKINKFFKETIAMID